MERRCRGEGLVERQRRAGPRSRRGGIVRVWEDKRRVMRGRSCFEELEISSQKFSLVQVIRQSRVFRGEVSFGSAHLRDLQVQSLLTFDIAAFHIIFKQGEYSQPSQKRQELDLMRREAWNEYCRRRREHSL